MRSLLIILIIAQGVLLFSSCSKENHSTGIRIKSESDPSMMARRIDVLFSDSGKIQARLTAPLMNEFTGKNPRMEFPEGFKIFMYDSIMRIRTTISARYGIRFEYKGYMEGRRNVVVRNELKNEQLDTEHLIWDERNHRIYNNDPIKITTPGKVLYGNDLESDENFTRYTFRNPTGEMKMKKDSI